MKTLISEDGYKIKKQKDGSYSNGDISYASLHDAWGAGFRPDTSRLRCDDCGRFARAEELELREPWLGGCRHSMGFGCWPVDFL